jgi:aspartate kinase
VETRKAGNDVVVVVSAMSGETNRLLALAKEVSPEPHERELDALVATGEQVSTALVAMAIRDLGVPAASYTGQQIRLVTDSAFTKARIKSIDEEMIKGRLRSGEIMVIAGFQGVDESGNITTLGRGGSDTSAVAVAAALGAPCDIYTDVDGVYTTDPRIEAKARKLGKISYEEMLEMASLGAKVLQTRSVEMAMKHRVRVQVLSSFEQAPGSDLPGTLVVDEDEIVEQELVSGIAYSRDEAKITLVGVADRPGVAARIFGPLADSAVNVDMIVQNVSAEGNTTDLTFTVSKADLERARKVLEEARTELGYQRLLSDGNVVKVSVIGVGMRSHAGVAQRMFSTLAEKNINIQVITTSEIKVSVLIAEEYTELALRALHTAYGLDVA